MKQKLTDIKLVQSRVADALVYLRIWRELQVIKIVPDRMCQVQFPMSRQPYLPLAFVGSMSMSRSDRAQ